MNSHSTPRSASPAEVPPSRRARRARSGDGVLAIKPFRNLWIALSLSSLGDWLSILALLWLAPSATHSANKLVQSSAISGVWVDAMLPVLLFGPIAGAIVDRFDRRVTMIIGDIIRGLLFISIPLFPNLTWIYVAKFLAGVATAFWTPAAMATIPNLVPKDKLERANQLSSMMTYGTAPLAACLIPLLGWAGTGLGHVIPAFHTGYVKQDLALFFNAASYFVSALTVYFLRQIGKREHSEPISVPSTAKAIWEGWRFIRQTPAVRGLVVGMVGAFCAAGVVVGLAPTYIQDTLGGGSNGFSLVFAMILIGLAIGMGFGARLFGNFSIRRLFGVTLAASAVPLAMIALVPNLAVVTVFVLILGLVSGIAYPTGFTIVGLEVDDDTRGRVFAFFTSTIQAIFMVVIVVASFIATGFSAAIGALAGSKDGTIRIVHITYGAPGDNLLLLLSAALVAYVGVKSYKELDDRKGVPLLADLLAAVRNEPLLSVSVPPHPDGARGHAGLFLAFEGGEGSGKTTQARLTAIWLRDLGYDVVTTHEPGATKIGMRLRALLLDTSHAGMSPQCEALLYSADRAEHVATVIDPALARGAVVISDRYIASSIAYQGMGRGLPTADITRLNSWATEGREPDLTILLDLPPEVGLSRRARPADRLEAEPLDFHRRVRAGFLTLARAKPDHYLVIDATAPPDEITEMIKDRVREILPDPVPRVAETATGAFTAIPDHTPEHL